MEQGTLRVTVEPREATPATPEAGEPLAAALDSQPNAEAVLDEDAATLGAASSIDESPARATEVTTTPLAESIPDGEALPRQDVLPFHSVRNAVPGARGCWALNSQGQPCGAAKLRDGDYCAAHSGIGVSANPAAYVELAHQRRRESLAMKTRMRLQLGVTRQSGPRAMLRAAAFADGERLVAAALSDAKKDGALALKLIREIDPAPKASLEVSMPTTQEQIEALSLSELRALVASLDATPPGEVSTS